MRLHDEREEQITYIKNGEIMEVPENVRLFIRDNFDEEYLKRMMNEGVIMNSDAEVEWISEDEVENECKPVHTVTHAKGGERYAKRT
jgi:hypothetical protein